MIKKIISKLIFIRIKLHLTTSKNISLNDRNYMRFAIKIQITVFMLRRQTKRHNRKVLNERDSEEQS